MTFWAILHAVKDCGVVVKEENSPLFVSIDLLIIRKLVVILPTVNKLIRRRGHYTAWKLLTSSFPVRIEMLRLMNKMSAKILKFWIG